MFWSIYVEKRALHKNLILGGFKSISFSCFVLLHQNTSVDCKITSSTTGDKHFDKSPTKARHPRKIDLRARYWAFLFDNLRRAVDEIYVTCESDQSVVECKVRFTLRLWNPFEVSLQFLLHLTWSFTSVCSNVLLTTVLWGELAHLTPGSWYSLINISCFCPTPGDHCSLGFCVSGFPGFWFFKSSLVIVCTTSVGTLYSL